jgi:3-oxoacyl-[acyl-carrier protein] reductase
VSDRPIALVTGAGTGIGSACARALDTAGFRVAVHYRSSEEQAREVAAKLSDALLVKADLAVPEQLDALVAELKERAGRVDVLVNNAGYNVNGLLPAMKLEDYDAVAAMARGT